jgi:acyl-CoA thioester hydrolase
MLSAPVSIAVEVRFRDLDAIGHVNNAVYLTYLEQARLAYWAKLTGRTDLRSIDIILARVEIDYRSPASLGETLDVAVRCVSMRRSSCTLALRLTERASGRLVAEAQNVVVYYDYAAARAQPIPDALRQRIRELDPGVREEPAAATGGVS